MSFRQTIIVATALIGLNAVAAAAVPPTLIDPNSVLPLPVVSGQPASPVSPDTDRDIARKIELRISDLHAKLQISPAQRPQWEQFTQVMRDNARVMEQSFQHRVQMLPTMTATENMQSYADISKEHAADMENLVPAFRALYSVMSATQQQRADQVFLDESHHGAQKPRG